MGFLIFSVIWMYLFGILMFAFFVMETERWYTRWVCAVLWPITFPLVMRGVIDAMIYLKQHSK